MNQTALVASRKLRKSSTLPWWRLGPCAFASIAIAFIPKSQPQPQSQALALQSELRLCNASDPNPLSPMSPMSPDVIERSLKSSMSSDQLSAANLTAANQVITALAPTDWLGPMAPLALSPFFGITCLSGLAIWSPDWLPGVGLLAQSTPLKSSTLFWVFAILTVFTSVPKLSKVSKPIAVVVDHVEAYAGIITLLVIRYMATSSPISSPESDPVLQAGILSFSLDALLYIAMIINVIVINSVKFFFEFLIWITPIPLLDACFEVANKTVCAALISIYAFSPMLATIFNLILFVGCLVVLRWVNRRVKYFRHMIFDSIWPVLSQSYGDPRRDELVVFPSADWNGFPTRTCLTLYRGQDGWVVRQSRLFRSPLELQLPPDARFRIEQGWMVNVLEIMTNESVKMSFSRRYQRRLDALAHRMDADVGLTSGTCSPIAAKAEFS